MPRKVTTRRVSEHPDATDSASRAPRATWRGRLGLAWIPTFWGPLCLFMAIMSEGEFSTPERLGLTAFGLVMMVLCVRGWRAGVIITPDSLVYRGALWTQTIPLADVKQIRVDGDVYPAFGSHSRCGLKVEARPKSGRRDIDCPAVYGPPRQIAEIVRDIRRDARLERRDRTSSRPY